MLNLIRMLMLVHLKFKWPKISSCGALCANCNAAVKDFICNINRSIILLSASSSSRALITLMASICQQTDAMELQDGVERDSGVEFN
ncbi:GH11054 [Drosophila grimshawi]|uniref:GH11054 n=1 Tax=Drosophila grimshawi TaxID=7222 RepID=B4JCE6_DROGR|nr:GH11054 [Drosophila grimshawi]